ncbi:MAG: hypothetical protein Q8P40_14405 [Nitrospirota bacterium]|nr:hypothetical protein [Nitrospirota bacterium]
MLELIDLHPPGTRLDAVGHIVQLAGQGVQVFLIQRGDKGGVDPVGKFVGDVVGLALYLLDPGGIPGQIGKIVDQGMEFLCRGYRRLRLLLKQLVKDMLLAYSR